MSADNRPPGRDDYLWDRAGRPDPLIAEIERVGVALRYEPSARPPLASRSAGRIGAPDADIWRRRIATVAVAAVVAAAVVVAMGWRGGTVCGTDDVGLIAADDTCQPLAIGAWFEHSGSESRSIELAGIGRVEVEPGTRLRVLESSADRKRMELAKGQVHALVTAPPRLFQVSTPAGTAIDMGCEYTLAVDASGDTELRVSLGAVIFEAEGEAITVPAGASTRIRAGFPAGVPVRSDAPAPVAELVSAVDGGDTRPQVLPAALVRARRVDAVTLWYLRGRVGPTQREQISGRLRELVPPPRPDADDAAWRAVMPF